MNLHNIEDLMPFLHTIEPKGNAKKLKSISLSAVSQPLTSEMLFLFLTQISEALS